MVDGLHVQHVGHGPLVANLLSKRAPLVERSPRYGVVATYADSKRQR